MNDIISISGKKKAGRPKIPEDVRTYRKVKDLVGQIVLLLAKKDTISNREFLDIRNTAGRVAKAWVNELVSYPELPVINTTKILDETICAMVQGPITFSSICAHHMMPFYGELYIGLLPREDIIGLSKYIRITECFSRRLQTQEKLGGDILNYLLELLDPIVCMVRIVSRHSCIVCRGVRQKSNTVTSNIWPVDGSAQDVYNELFTLINQASQHER